MSTDSSRAAVWGARDPPAIIGKDGAAHAGVPRQGVFGNWRHRGVRARAQLLSPRVRHRAGVHGGDARPCNRPERDQVAHCRHGRRDGTPWMGQPRRLPRYSARPNRAPLANSTSRRQGVSRWIRCEKYAAEDVPNQQIGALIGLVRRLCSRNFNVWRVPRRLDQWEVLARPRPTVEARHTRPPRR